MTYGTTTVQVALTSAADRARTMLRVHQERMASAEQRERQRTHWQRVMNKTAGALDQG